jgi:hypothetical protein
VTVIDRSDGHYEEVPALGRVVKEQVPANGKTWELVRFVGSAAYLPDTRVKLVWDVGGAGEEVIASTHGDANLEMVRQVVGDGTRKLALVLENDSLAARVLGGRYEAREL